MTVGLGLEGVRGDLADLRAVALLTDQIRKHLSETAGSPPSVTDICALHKFALSSGIPQERAWKVHDHCAVITRLYAVYESYALELIRLWLSHLTTLCPRWTDLPGSVCSQYRLGIGYLLQKYGRGVRTEHLTEIGIVEGLYAGLSGGASYTLLPDAFFVDLQNLREGELAHLCKSVGMGEVSGWLSANPDLAEHCASNEYTVTNRLKQLVDYRNDAAHGAIHIDEVLGITELLCFHEFVGLICEALAQFLLENLCDKASQHNACKSVGKTIEYFKKPQASVVRMADAELTQGDVVIVRGAGQCYQAEVLSLQIDGKDVERVCARDGDEVGVRLNPIARVGTEVSRLELPHASSASPPQP